MRPESLVRTLLGGSLLILAISAFIVASLFAAPARVVGPIKPLLRLCFRGFGWRIRVTGLENLPKDRAHLFMCNHVSIVDPMLLLSHFPGYFVGLEKAEARRLPIYGWASRRWGQIPINRGDRAAALEACAVVRERLAAGIRVAIFPEGTRTRDGQLAPFKKGGFHIAVDAPAEVVPVAIRGLYPLAPRGALIFGSGEVEIRVGRPISPPAPGPEAAAELESTVRTAIVALQA